MSLNPDQVSEEEDGGRLFFWGFFKIVKVNTQYVCMGYTPSAPSSPCRSREELWGWDIPAAPPLP